MKKILVIISITLFLAIKVNAQKNDTIYIEYNKFMSIIDSENEVLISFTIKSPNDTKVNTYNFKTDNFTDDFKLLRFEEIKDSISKSQFKQLNISTTEQLSKMDPCELHYLLSDMEHLFLIQKKAKKYFIYRLIYLSTQRGWSIVNTH
ncbi:hypothetical protein AB9K26_13980 [Psychroserpens sp. XS_ASV72]|uniref:hypothetical protein n=1 Tax=Psychroserpens sp. XS_ASV72 TaxID=3241293 RepID=UPI00351667CE